MLTVVKGNLLIELFLEIHFCRAVKVRSTKDFFPYETTITMLCICFILSRLRERRYLWISDKRWKELHFDGEYREIIRNNLGAEPLIKKYLETDLPDRSALNIPHMFYVCTFYAGTRHLFYWFSYKTDQFSFCSHTIHVTLTYIPSPHHRNCLFSTELQIEDGMGGGGALDTYIYTDRSNDLWTCVWLCMSEERRTERDLFVYSA